MPGDSGVSGKPLNRLKQQRESLIMLKNRIITIIALLPIAVSAILFLPTNIFSFFIMVCVAVAGYEWARLSGFGNSVLKFLYPVCLVVLGLILWRYEIQLSLGSWLYWFALVWWALAFFWIVLYQQGLYVGNISGAMKLLVGVLVLLPPWYAVTELHALTHQGPQLVLYAFAIVWCADIGAYLIGRQFGQRKLASRVSPGKTLEGVLGAMVAVMLLALGGFYYFDMQGLALAVFVVITLVAALVSIVGDLYESLLKRYAGVKDSGSILPGHGGMLDRIDSLTASMPVFVFAYLCWLA